MESIKKFIDYLEDNGLYPDFPVIEDGVNEPICYISKERYLMFCSNNYLGLTENKNVKDAGVNSIKKYGMGPGGSRVISGNVEIIEALEKNISKLTNTEDCLTFPTGYMANIAVFNAMLNPFMNDLPFKSSESVVISDEFNHGSIVDGIKLANVTKFIYKHNDFKDLEAKLNQAGNYPNKLVVTEGVFSLEGTITNLKDLLKITKKYKAKLMIDDAHGIGIVGSHGGGVVDLYNCSNEVDILMGCMDKAFGGTGGFLCGKSSLIKFLRIASRSSLLSSAIPTVMAGAMNESVNQILSSQKLIIELYKKANYLRTGLKKKGFRILGNDKIPAIALYLGEEKLGLKFSRILFDNKVFCPLIR